MAFKPTLSEDPDALKGASEWATKEIERMEQMVIIAILKE